MISPVPFDGQASARQFAGAALVDPQAYVAAVHYFHEADIHPFGKTRMTFQQRPECGHGCVGDGVDLQHGVRVAHRYRADGDAPARQVDVVLRCRAVGDEGDVAGIEARRAHVDADAAVGLDARTDDAARGLHHEFGFIGEPAFENVAHEAACAVAVLLALDAV